MGFLECALKGLVFVVDPIGKSNVVWVEIFENPVHCRQLHLFFCDSAEELRFARLVAEMHDDGVALGDDFVAIEQIGQGEGWVPLEQFGFVLIEPLGPSLSTLVSDFAVGNAKVLEDLPDALRESPDSPVA